MPKRVPFDPLATAREKPLSIKTLSLNPADLYNKGKLWEAAPAFPREILACKKLEKLLLFRDELWFDDLVEVLVRRGVVQDSNERVVLQDGLDPDLV